MATIKGVIRGVTMAATMMNGVGRRVAVAVLQME